MKVEVVWYTGRGRVREENEDSLLVGNRIFNREEMKGAEAETVDIHKNCFAVADGMGGYAGGAIASGIIVKELSRCKEIEEGLLEAKNKMEEIGRENGRLCHMGSVVTGVWIDGGKVTVFNVGDSRTYLLKEKLLPLTEDDSIVWDFFKDDELSPGELHERIRKHPQKNIVTSAIMAGGEGFNLQKNVQRAREGDRYLICSDGLWEELTYKFMEEVLKIKGRETGVRLKEKAMKGGRDNISFILVEIKSE